jgi:drug/metabolite transporter (DMT)-like permease
MRFYVWGLITMACWVIATLFIRYWRTTRDRLFLFFGLAFVILSLSWLGLAIFNPDNEHRHYAHIPRLIAFLLIIFGIVDKNRR